MPLLDRDGVKIDAWRRDDAEAPHRLLPLEALPSGEEAGNACLGLEIANTARLPDLQPHLDRVGLIAIRFPAYSDGRGLSLARQLREAGYAGTLRAVGPLIADQFPQALACGFDEVEVPEAHFARQPAEHWQAALHSITRYYQRGHGGGATILDRRRAAREQTP